MSLQKLIQNWFGHSGRGAAQNTVRTARVQRPAFGQLESLEGRLLLTFVPAPTCTLPTVQAVGDVLNITGSSISEGATVEIDDAGTASLADDEVVVYTRCGGLFPLSFGSV